MTFGCHGAETHEARERMRRIFEGVTGKAGTVEQGICLWTFGSMTCPGGAQGFDRAASTIEAALRAKGVNAFADITSFEVGDATYERGDGGILKVSAVVRVKITLNGAPLEVRCIDGEPVTWID